MQEGLDRAVGAPLYSAFKAAVASTDTNNTAFAPSDDAWRAAFQSWSQTGLLVERVWEYDDGYDAIQLQLSCV